MWELSRNVYDKDVNTYSRFEGSTIRLHTDVRQLMYAVNLTHDPLAQVLNLRVLEQVQMSSNLLSSFDYIN